jgi:hypothetical protein
MAAGQLPVCSSVSTIRTVTTGGHSTARQVTTAPRPAWAVLIRSGGFSGTGRLWPWGSHRPELLQGHVHQRNDYSVTLL